MAPESRAGDSTNVCAIELRDVCFRYERGVDTAGSNDHPWVLNNVSCGVRPAEILGVIGPNGSGKSSLLKVMAGLVGPQQGSAALFGRAMHSLSREMIARDIAYMPQDLSFDFPVTVTDAVLMGRYPHRRRGLWNLLGWEGEADFAVVEEAMILADVIHLADRMIGAISAGERQRALLARALAQQPRVLLLDEPTAHLDLNHQLDACRILTQIHGSLRMTIVLVSHDINLAAQFCDRLVVVKQGAVVSIGTPSEIIRPRLLKELYGCDVLVDEHPESGLPRVCLPYHPPRQPMLGGPLH